MSKPTKAPWAAGIIAAPIASYLTLNSRDPTWTIVPYYIVMALVVTWLNLVNKHVPEPYLDEVFHIPQAQMYCSGRYDYWDPKLTTPPGLYIFANIFIQMRRATCDVANLRMFNAFVLPITLMYAMSIRMMLESGSKSQLTFRNAVHTGLNIGLFPPLFFFSGLFYTDLLSTCIVLVAYRFFLQNSRRRSWAILPTGLVALAMRQTNIFWVAIFLGGLEAVRTVKTIPKKDGIVILPAAWKDRLLYELDKWARGEIHDIALQDAAVHDFFLCAMSIVFAILYRPFGVLINLLPYVGLLILFGAFVVWNGGVVLGDKSNHVATIHIPQLLYLVAFTAFFSLPLVLSPTFRFLLSLRSLFRLPLFPRLEQKYLLTTIYCIFTLVITLVVISFNTIIHPFTLADNRHYVFYVFRYTILRHPLARYFLGPVYIACGWAVYLTLCVPNLLKPDSRLNLNNNETYNSPSPTAEQIPRTPETTILRGRTKFVEPTTDEFGKPNTSFLLVFLLTTALSLITAPLVEPRYLIIPWVIWRLHVPPLISIPQEQIDSGQRIPAISKSFLSIAYRSHDYRLWLETLWFLAINLVTGYIFLYRGFSWPQEPGKVQRFMW